MRCVQRRACPRPLHLNLFPSSTPPLINYVEHEGQLIPSQEAPPRPNILRGVNGYPSHAPSYRNGLGSRWERVLASLDRERAEAIDGNHDNGAARIRRKATSVPRKPTPKQIARWEAVHAAKRRGLSIRAITKETGIHRKTVRKYLIPFQSEEAA